MAELKSIETNSLARNAVVVQKVLEDLELGCEVPEMEPKDDDTVLINVPFSDDNGQLAFVLFLFVHESKSLIRTYAHMFSPGEGADIGKLLSIINELNHSHLLDASVDYSRPANGVRFRAKFSSASSGLAPRAVSRHLLKVIRVVDTVSLILRTAMDSPKEFEGALEDGKRALSEKAQWDGGTFM